MSAFRVLVAHYLRYLTPAGVRIRDGLRLVGGVV